MFKQSVSVIFTMMANASVTNVASNKYIVLSQQSYVIHNNKYKYNNIRQ